MTRLARIVAPGALTILALGSLSAAVRVDERPAPGITPPPSTPTAVLSARRVPALLVADAADRATLTRVDEALASIPAASCLVVRDGDQTLVSRAPELPLIPASTMKLMVAVAARRALGDDHRFVTRVVTDASREAGAVHGDLFVIGGGDPLLTTAEYSARYRRQPQTRTSLEALADAVVATGVTVVDGAVIGDETRYDTQRYLPSWRPIYLADHETGPMSALSVNDGFVAWEPRIEPAGQPAVVAAAVLTDLLEARGVDVAGEPRADAAPSDAVELARVESPALADVVAQMLRESDNQTAEMLVKELGLAGAGAGTTAAGRPVVVEAVASAGIDATGAVVVDGSGLDRGNRLTCRTLIDALDAEPWLTEAVAVAGESGTLEHRFRDDPVRGRLRAKTGSIDGVAALAGVLTTDAGHEVRFAFIVNDLPSAKVGTALQDGLIEALRSHPDPGDLARLAPEAVDG